ncbi:MAG: hypothetical protein MI757_20065, partial [Pirellulales bacterium]|nr:hypothetical protein [Pirellulales bacterium]
ERYDELKKAEREGRTTPVTLEQVKFSLGGLLMKWSCEWEQRVLKGELLIEVMQRFVTPKNCSAIKRWTRAMRKRGERLSPGCRLNAPAIKQLFDAVARDTGEGLVDPAFVKQPNSNYKRLKRNSELWPSLRETDISRAA